VVRARQDNDTPLILAGLADVLTERLLTDVRNVVGTDVRVRDGYFFSHIETGARTASELGRRLGMTQQAASKHVAELELRGFVRKELDPRDGRQWRLVLTPRARKTIRAGDRARERLRAEMVAVLGERGVAQLDQALVALSDRYGARAMFESGGDASSS
jgi:DNA-binding MarR family transcriptional regulator